MLAEAETTVNRGALLLSWVGGASLDRLSQPRGDPPPLARPLPWLWHPQHLFPHPLSTSNTGGNAHGHRPSAVCPHTLLSNRAIKGMLRANPMTFAGHVD